MLRHFFFLQTAADIVKTATAPQGTTTETVGTGIGTIVEETETVIGIGTVTAAAAAAGDMAMTDVSATDPPVLLGTMMTIRDVRMKMVDAPVTVAATMTAAVLAVEEVVVMTAGSEVSAAVAVGEGTRMVLVPRREGLQLRKAPFPCRRGGGRRPDGMFLLRVMSSIQPCRLSKQVSLIFLEPIGHKSRPSSASPVCPPPMPVQTFGMGMGGNPNLSRQSRRLYIGSITPEVTEQNLADFFNVKMEEMKIGTGGPGNPVLAVQCNYEKNYAFVEFRSAEDATSAMAFDGIIFINGPLKIRRPKDYGGMDLSNSPGVHVPGVVSTNVPDTINKVFVGGLPSYLNEEQVMELLKSFGELKAFNLGFAFFEYVDTSVTDVAIQSLNGMELGDKFLVVQRASVGAKPGMPGMIPNLPYDQFPEIPRPIMPAGDNSNSDARILLMLNMVTPDDLTNDDEYGDLYDDVKEECENFGQVEDLRIPRPVKKDKSKWAPGESGGQIAAADAARIDEAAGVGRVYVKYTDPASAGRALKGLAGRSFAGRSIIATILSEDSQTTPPLHIIFAPQPDAPPPLPTS
ncbi:U2 snRNP auxiliary factor large subunit [Mycena venus]|uniref:U2 snRNP auxiliary factor large subunit n=1 Tax=Mycena venus TaxID=2733690 RepID=A0A8H7D273_9AGAR|nr:U2 snRNP auxiliary factor large subunit [Mycena venus]